MGRRQGMGEGLPTVTSNFAKGDTCLPVFILYMNLKLYCSLNLNSASHSLSDIEQFN